MVNTIQNQLQSIIAASRAPNENMQQSEGKSAWKITLVACILLAAITLAAYGRTLTTYFIADDFGEVAYVSRIAHGNWNLFWSNWTGNYMQIPGMAVYRPFLLVSLLTDYLLFKTNSVGYYATNLLFYIGDTLLLFLVAQKLTQSWGTYRATAVAFLSAMLFAVSPLHCETVSWVVGRVDSSCLLLSLASIYAYLRSRDYGSKAWLGAAVALFLGGLMFKEMAIGVPVLATAIAVLFPKTDSKRVAWFWVATAAYFVLRFIVLGTLVGGYTGAIGDGQATAWIQRWLDVHNYERLLFPFGVSLFPANNQLSGALKIIYASAVTLLVLKTLRGELPWRHSLLLGAWLVSAALPIYKLWGIGMDIEGARFCFFLSVPMSIIMPMLLLAPKGDRAFQILSVIVIGALAFVNYKTTLHTNANWVHAGKEVHAVLNSAVEIAHQNPNKQLIVLGVPKRRAGAHMIYNGATFKTMLQPPFTKPAIADRFLTFDPIFYGPDQYINADRFRQTLQRADVAGAFVWNDKTQNFDLVQPNAASQPDFVEVQCNVREKTGPVKFFVSWSTKDSEARAERKVMQLAPGTQKVLVPLSHYWRWFTTPMQGSRPKVECNAPDSVDIISTELKSASTIRPALDLPGKHDDGSGVFVVDSATKLNAVARAPGAAALQIECSKPNYFFDQIEEADQPSAVYKSFVAKGNSFDGIIPNDFAPKAEYCELRARALDAQGKPVGEYSEPIIIYSKN